MSIIPLAIEQQTIAQSAASGSIYVNAGPGSGKTRVLAARAAYLIASGTFSGNEIVALTYTRAMAADLAHRIRTFLPESVPCCRCAGAGTVVVDGQKVNCGHCAGSGTVTTTQPLVGTLHALAYRWVKDALAGRIAGAAEVLALGWLTGEKPDVGIATPEDVDDILDAVQADIGKKRITKKALVEGLALSGDHLHGWPMLTELRHQIALRNLVTYDDLLAMLYAVVTARRGTTGLRLLTETYRCLLVDEGQDLTEQHWAILDVWGNAAMGRAHMTAVGDDGQAIFGFLRRRAKAWTGRGAPPSFSQRIAARLDAGEAQPDLAVNHRSRPALIAACREVRRVLAQDGACGDLALAAPAGYVEGPGLVLFERTDDVPRTVTNDVLEMLAVLSAALDLVRPAEDIAVLAYTWEELGAIAAAFDAHGISYVTPARGRDEWGTLAGRAVIALARCAANGAADERDVRTVLRAFGHGDPGGLVERARRSAGDSQRSLAAVLDESLATSPDIQSDWWSDVCKCGGSLDDLVDCMARVAHIGSAFRDVALRVREVAVTAVDYESSPMTAADFLVWVSSDDVGLTPQRKSGHVNLSTIHAAKGLEWKAVIVAGASEGAIPTRWAKTDEDIAECGRALYVAMTRAIEDLRIVSPRMLRDKPREPSRWLVRAGLVKFNIQTQEWE